MLAAFVPNWTNLASLVLPNFMVAAEVSVRPQQCRSMSEKVDPVFRPHWLQELCPNMNGLLT